MSKTEYKLKCFRCGSKFWNKKEVFRGRSGYPICESCCGEEVDMDFDNYEQVLELIKSKFFNNNYRKFLKYIEKECKPCPKCNTYVPKNKFVGNICQQCFEIKSDGDEE